MHVTHLVVAQVEVLKLVRACIPVDQRDVGEQIVLELDHPKVAEGRQGRGDSPTELVVLELELGEAREPAEKI